MVREQAFRALIRCSVLLRRHTAEYLGRWGISGAQWGVLRTLGRAKDAGVPGLRLRDLGEQMLVRPPSMTGVVDRLERGGYLRKRASAGDKRAKEVSLTPKGRGLLQSILRRQHQRVDLVTAHLSDAEARTLLRLIERLSTRLAGLQQQRKNGRINPS